MSRETEETTSRAPLLEAPGATEIARRRRAMLKKASRFAAVSAPAMTLLLAAGLKPKKAAAVS